jgi:hypothetical protein
VAPLDLKDITDQRDHAASAEPSEQAEPTENADNTEPIEPIESAEPIDPIDRNEPLDPIERTESSDHNDHRDLDISSGLISIIAHPPSSCTCHFSRLHASARTPGASAPGNMTLE